ncbi:hypothetical protein NDU88_002769 [Pleurodeles waltl]|uniref:Uncharacterized protein n=1 Tax=Pleurodeles waltl TaxID=8319 RepID=A0AAV7NHD0_PLEWA|nr:hypothetical protein NDU88_002769 [Pleurodeles waltl]
MPDRALCTGDRWDIVCQWVEREHPRHRGKRRHTRDSVGGHQVTKPTNQQVHQEKRAALQVAASLTEVVTLPIPSERSPVLLTPNLPLPT